ncbi:MAG: cation diffusion facilitator family transporter [Spirochaetes bacterium]|nr:cation diffusion facilitator family transporter [Spirochaetota bacterium]
MAHPSGTPAPTPESPINPPQSAQGPNLGMLEGWISVVLNTLLFGAKYWFGARSGSVSMTADAWHTLSDTLTSVVVIVGFFIMARPADKEHPFGHARAESIAAIVIGVLLAVVGGSFFLDSVRRLIAFQAATFSVAAIVVFAVSIVLKEALAQFAFWAGRKINSRAVSADGWHHRSDAIASALIVAGALAGRSVWWMDGALGIGVSLLILWAAIEIVRGSASPLLGESVDAGTEQRVADAIRREYAAVEDVHHLHVHRYGRNVELTVHVRLPAGMTVEKAHGISQRMETRLADELGIVATVHVEPRATEPQAAGSRTGLRTGQRT